MAMYEKQQKILVFEDRNGVELPVTDEDVPRNGTSVAGVHIGNIANHPYLENNPYQELANDDNDDNTADDT